MNPRPLIGLISLTRLTRLTCPTSVHVASGIPGDYSKAQALSHGIGIIKGGPEP